MNKRIAVLALLFSVVPMQGSFELIDEAYNTAQIRTMRQPAKKTSLRRLSSAYALSLLLSGAIGAATGTVVRSLEKHFDFEASPIGFFLIILVWTIESEFRNDIIAVLQNDLNVNNVDYKRSLMFKSAWVASWLAYLRA